MVLARFLLAVWLLGSLGCAGWVIVQPGSWRVAAAGVLVIGVGYGAWSSWAKMTSGQLIWDGTVWFWEGVGYQSGRTPQTLEVVLDLQTALLLRLENQAGAALWLWAERSLMPERWLDLRRAAHAGQLPAPNRDGSALSARRLTEKSSL